MNTLKHWTRPVKTGGGVSKKAYKTKEGDCPHAGEIQGSANVMGNWTNTSDAILSIQAEKNKGINTQRHKKLAKEQWMHT